MLYSSYDLRKKDQKDTHWIEKSVLGTRAYFRTMSEPAALVIEGVEVTDEADYRCRVDFSRSPTRNYKLKLVVTGQSYQWTIYKKLVLKLLYIGCF